MFVFILSFLTITLASGYKYTACNFDRSYENLCGWYVEPGYYCQWTQKLRHYSKKGYLYLNGTDDCTANLTKTFGMFDGWSDEYFTIEYYVIGPGPFTLKVSTYKLGEIWSCEIQPRNSIKRMARVFLPGKTDYLHILGKVAKGSQIIITQIWDDLRGGSVQKHCPLLPTTLIPTTKPASVKITTTKRPTTRLTKGKTTRHPATKITSFSKQKTRKTSPKTIPITTKIAYTGTRKETVMRKTTSALTTEPTIRKMPKRTKISTPATNTNISSFWNISSSRWPKAREHVSKTAGITTEKVKIEKSMELMIDAMTKKIILCLVIGVSASTIIISFVVLIRKCK